MKHRVIGQGTYGCLHKESLVCQDFDSQNKNMVSKVMLKKDAYKEMNNNLLIHFIDEKEEFHLGNPKTCTIQKSRSNRKAIKQCKPSKHIDRKNIGENMLILMKDGGITLDQFASKVKRLHTNKNNIQKIERFWIEVHRLFRGLVHFNKYDFIHHDMKPQNILYNEKTNRVNFIDFGASSTFTRIKQLSRNSENRGGSEWWSYPPEYKYVNKNTYISSINKMDKNQYKNILRSVLKREKDDIAYHLRGFLPYISAWKYKYLTDLEWLYTNGLDDYDTLIHHSIYTFDIYGVGFSLLQILNSSYHLMNKTLWDDLSNLLYLTITPNYIQRIQANELLNKYEQILEENNLLKKYKLIIKDHEILF